MWRTPLAISLGLSTPISESANDSGEKAATLLYSRAPSRNNLIYIFKSCQKHGVCCVSAQSMHTANVILLVHKLFPRDRQSFAHDRFIFMQDLVSDLRPVQRWSCHICTFAVVLKGGLVKLAPG